MIHYIIAILFSILIYFIGLLVLSIFKILESKFQYKNILLKYCIGLLALIIIYGVIITKFKSIFLISLIGFVVYIIISKKQFESIKNLHGKLKNTLRFEWKQLLFLQFVLFLFVVYQYYSTGYLMGIKYNSVNEDISFYITQSEYLNETGIENLNTFYNNYLSNPIKGISPYHYFDLYINAFLFNTIGFINNMEIYLFIFLPFCFLMIALSFITIFELYVIGHQALIIFLGTLFTFFIGFFPLDLIGLKGNDFLGGFGHAPAKYLPSYLYLVLLWIFYSESRKNEIAFLIAIMPTLNIIYLFHLPLMGIVLLYSCIKIWYDENSKLKFRAFLPTIIPMVVTAGIVFIYIFFGQTSDSLLQPKQTKIFDIKEIDFKVAKTIFLFGIVKMVLFFLPLYVIIGSVLMKHIDFIKNHFVVLFLIISLGLWGILGHALFQTNDEAWQLEDIFFMSVIKILLAIMLSRSIHYILSKKNVYQLLYIIPLSLVLVVTIYATVQNIKQNNYLYSYNPEFIQNLKPYSKFFENPGVVLVDTTGFSNSSMKGKPYLIQHAGITKFLTKKSSQFSISVPLPKDLNNYKSEKIKKEILKSPMGQFLTNKNINSSLETLQFEFIRKNSIKYLIVSKHISIPKELKAHILKEFYDPKSMQKVYIFDFK